jgi:uncharacterized protein YheU (UPF0270 family)
MISMEKKSELPPLEIPLEQLSQDALHGIIESFILREGTDYGREEVHFETKYRQIQKQIEKGDAKIVFDPNTETVSLVTVNEWRNLSHRKN